MRMAMQRQKYTPLTSSHTNGGSSDEFCISDHEIDYTMVNNRIRLKPVKLVPTITSNRWKWPIGWGLGTGRRLKGFLFCSLLMLFVFLYSYHKFLMRQYPLSDWGPNASFNIAEYVLPQNDTTLMEPRNICQTKLFLLIVVFSGIQNFVARQTIRETWANLSEFNYDMFRKLHLHMKHAYLEPTEERIQYYKSHLRLEENATSIPGKLPLRVVFMLGRQDKMVGSETELRIQQEAEQYDDIIQENFLDTYNNLTIKSVMTLKWLINSGCQQKVAFFMKCDDDTFVNIPNLLHFLLGGTVPVYNLSFYNSNSYRQLLADERLNATNGYLVGYMFCKARPIANITSKWYMPFYMYAADEYPRYLSGAGYLMSMDVALRLYQTALHTKLVYLEDVYLTGICAKRAHIQPRNHPLFSYTRSRKLCTFKAVITQHEMKDDTSMYEAYNFVTNLSVQCPPPSTYLNYLPLRKANDCI